MTEKRRRGIYLLPNLFTTAGLFAGFYAILVAMDGRFEAAAVAIFIAMIMDGLDGRVARMTNTQSDFGMEYDSLADMVSFGLAPSLVVYQWALADLVQNGWGWGKVAWAAAFIYTAGGALRLARFNTQAESTDKRYFQGLPSPAAAALMAGMVWVGTELGIDGAEWWLPALLLTVSAGLLMVSNVRYHSFKDLDLRNRVPFVAMLVLVLAFVLTSIDPPKVLFGVFLLYAVSGPVLTLVNLRKMRAARRGNG
ncbi:CDP-diacylglycerol--serine O-phosphatidyltransferase [Solemya pervernicosa gill symbiont]|uniref:CDP-diacylglycerol--serine O-phosphatidyltransferase n=2 Tax=Gammaproteobacteria incertae sedis TaxID=118884 RepID=A0A1T2L8Q1_9GAMM|nr:CDP-diacylglycerol--serine O-phosphatidyltransferase [Candidatus Reidiella endopervernicosa]OOZ41412.1 CDP-diacylglycerol--serine O-phosphatidyltransferase [Solemya pervernicosa gill symbiont]QKQ27550.1 CDP-diacylglycerol--serine O-phosphatidyltransferase [Candidatus Reidiella endopervernicosa]